MKARKWIGVDLHKKQMTICVIKKDGNKSIHQYERSSDGIEKLLSHVDDKTIVGIESTTWTRDLACKLLPKSQDVIIFNTIELKKLMDRTKKTDRIDAHKIAVILRRFEKDELSICNIKSDYYAEIKGLLNIRETLVRKKIELKNNIIAMLDYWGSSRKKKLFGKHKEDKIWINEQVDIPINIRLAIINLYELVESFEIQISDLDKNIEEKLKDNKAYSSLKDKIIGIGKTTSAYIVSKVENIDRFENHKKLVSYFGLAPKVNESDGKGRNGHISKNTDKGLLRVLVQSAWASVRFDQEMKSFYNNLRIRTGKQKAIIAVARKLVVNTFFVLKQATA